MENGSTDTTDLIAQVQTYPEIATRLWLTHVDDGWQVRFGDVLLGADAASNERTWSYPTDVFLAGRLDGPVVAELMRGHTQLLRDRKVTASAPQGNCNFDRLPGQLLWNRSVLPRPRTEWLVHPATQIPSTGSHPILVGDGPTFLDSNAAFWSFFHGTAPNPNASRPNGVWRVVMQDRRAWLHRVTITPDAVTVLVKGTDLDGVRVELTTPTSHLIRPIGKTGRIRLRLPRGLAPGTLLILRTDDDWLDYRHFPSSDAGHHSDQSVVWDLPGAQVSLLIAGGETDLVEFKCRVPEGDSRKKMLKTVAAFASGQDGGTVLIGVEDDTRVIGVDPAKLDELMLQLRQMIRNMIDPEPPCQVRPEQVDGKVVLLIEVEGTGRWHGYDRVKPEFYLRRGASTVPARISEIEHGFGAGQPSPHGFWRVPPL